jgi:hypothetical protein
MHQSLGVSDIVHRNYIEASLSRCPEETSTDSSEPVDSNLRRLTSTLIFPSTNPCQIRHFLWSNLIIIQVRSVYIENDRR